MRNAFCGCVATAVLLMSGTLTFANDINGTVGRIPDWRLCLRLGKFSGGYYGSLTGGPSCAY
jgi:hypothetical protein